MFGAGPQFEKSYRVPPEGADLDDDFFNRRFKDVDLRLVALEGQLGSYDNAVDALIERGLSQINTQLQELIESVQGDVSATETALEAVNAQITALEEAIAAIVSGSLPAASVTVAAIDGLESATAQDAFAELAAGLANGASVAGEMATDLDGKCARAANLSDLTDADAALTNLGVSAYMQTLLGVADDAAARNALGVNTLAEAKSANYTVSTDDRGKLLAVSALGASRTITLPAAATFGDGFEITVQKSDISANTVTIEGDGYETIDAATSCVLRLVHNAVTLRCDGENWSIVASHLPPERGRNANGDYVRLADGTQICWRTGVTFNRQSTSLARFSWTFPAAFSDHVSGIACSRSNQGGDYTGDITITSVGGYATANTGTVLLTFDFIRIDGSASWTTGAIANCRVLAIGRWF